MKLYMSIHVGEKGGEVREEKKGGGGGRKATEFLGEGRRRRQILEHRSLAPANNRRHVICFLPSSFRPDLSPFPFLFVFFLFLSQNLSNLMMILGNRTEKSNPPFDIITQQESDLNGSDNNRESDLHFSQWANTKPTKMGLMGRTTSLNCFPHSKRCVN